MLLIENVLFTAAMWIYFAAMILYFVFDYILGQCRGFFVYGFVEVEELSVLAGLIVLASVYVLVFFISWGFLALNRKFRLMK